jgi:sugar/nucleoside kinase (ribokinase family)
VRSADAAGLLVAGELERRGVELAGPRVPAGTGRVVALVDGEGERTMATDRGVATELRVEDLAAAWFSGCDRLHLSGYSLLRSPIDGAARRAAREARAAGARVSVDLLVVERDPRLRAGGVPRAPRRDPPRRDLRERGGARGDRGAAAGPGAGDQVRIRGV